MRKLILSFIILALMASALYFTQKSSAAVSTTIAPAGTSLSTQNSPLWKYPTNSVNCAFSSPEPYASYTFDITASGDYTFTMSTSGFPSGVPGQIFVYRTVSIPTAPCTNIVNIPDSANHYITGSPLTLALSASSTPTRYVVVFTAKNIVQCPGCPNQSIVSSNVNGTFSASVSGPAAVTLVQNVTTTIAGAGTPLNSQNDYSWNYPLKSDCSNLSGTVPFAAYKITVASAGLYTFTMNTSGFAGAIHVYSNFTPGTPCYSNDNPTDGVGNIITGTSITIPLDPSISGFITKTVVFSAHDTGGGGTFSASVTGPGAVTLVPPGDLAIASQPSSKSVTSGCVQTLSVYVTGPLPQTFQWYEGISGDLSTSVLISGATSNTYTTPALTSDRSYWVRVASGSDHVDSDTISFKVYPANKTTFSGSLDPNQTWNLTTNLCHPTGNFVHYQTTTVRIPATGTYRIHVTRHSNFTGQYAINLYTGGGFDATQPCGSFATDGTVNTDLVTNLLGGQTFDIVVSAAGSGMTGDFDASISTTNDCSLPETLEQALIISGNPLDKAITPGNTATLTLAYTGGTGTAKSIQWYKGFSGDTSQPIANATQTTYTTPVLNQSPPNQPTYYYYWARVSDSGQTTHADTRTAVINVLNPPITYADVLSQCDEIYTQINGPASYYKIYPFTVSTNGAYTFNITANGFTPAVRLYQGFFSPDFPNINYYGPGITQNLLAGPNTYYLVITSTAVNQTGSFTLTINGPALIVPTPRPIITAHPTDKILFRNQTATLNVTSTTPDVSYQWYTGTCTNKTAVSDGNLSSYTTPPMTDYQDYWVKVSYGVMYVNSNIAHVQIRPQAITDPLIIDEDTTLKVAAPGLLANDKKADSKTLKAFKVTDPTLGTRTLGDDGTLTYTPNPNVKGPDVFQYKVSDGTLESDPENVAILIREINDPPVRTGGAMNDQTFNEDAPAGILHLGGLTYGPGGGTDEATQTLTYKVTAVPPANVGNVVLADGATVVTANTNYTLAQIQGMKFAPAANGYGGPYPFTITVTDDGTSRGVFDPQTLTQSLNITVNAVADTPSVTNGTTNEDTQTTSGLVLDRNAADGSEVGYFKIATIKNGTLFKNDGVTQITEQFITYAEGHAGLKFKPNANLSSPNTIFSFEVQASLTNALSGLGGNPVTATITVNPVAEQPAVTGGTTFVNLQTTSGLVVTRNPADGTEIGYYKISSITNGTLYKADGATQISEGRFITVADGAAGLRFTPAQDSTAQGSFNVQGSADTSGSGLGPAATANITVSKYSTSTAITSDNPAPSYLDQQVTVNYSVLNTSGGPAPTGDVVVAVSGGSETCTATVAAGSCTLTLSSAGNPRTITATYSGNSQFQSSSGTKDHVVKTCTQNAVVTSAADDGTTGTLRYVVANVCEGSTITFDPTVFDPANGPYIISLNTFGNISGNLLINKNLIIKGPGANILTVRRSTLSRAARSRIFNIASGATVNISGLTISNGATNTSADPDGGGILNSGTLTLNACAITGNQAGRAGLPSGSGGGIYNKGSLTLINSTVSGNNAFISGGGGIFIENGSTANIINSTISGNTATTSGGGLAVSGSANIVNSTVTNNTGTVSGGGIYHELGTTTIGNSIVAGNTSVTGPDVLLLSGIINTSGHNLIGQNAAAESAFPSGSPNTGADIVGTSSSPVLALIGSLADNGGATQTHLPLPGSPALDAGSNANLPQDTFDLDGNSNTVEPLPLDQRGHSRIANTTVDIGAVEASYSVAATAGAGQSAMINSSFAAPLQATVTESGKPESGVSVTFTAPGSGAGGTFNGNLIATATTDNNGVVTAPALTANGTAGNYSVVASLAAVTTSATFTLTNTQAQAQVILDNLIQGYDGLPKPVSVTTVPSGLTVTLTYDGSATPPTNAGAYQATAIISDPNYLGQATATLNIGKADQTINFSALPNKTAGAAPFALNATATSGLPVSFNVVSGPASINGNVLMLTGSGTVAVRASQAGDGNHNPALSVEQSFEVNKAQASITLDNLNQTYDGTAKKVAVTTNPPNLNTVAVRYSQNGTAVTAPTNTGSYDVVASLSNDDYQASDATGTLVIAKANQSISFDAIPNKTYGDAPININASASSGLPVSLSIVSGPATISGHTITLTGAGVVTIRAAQAGDSSYNAAPPVDQALIINQASQTITFAALPAKSFGDADFTVSAEASSGLGVSFAATGQCLVTGTSVHLTGAGSCSITASQAGNSDYSSATNVSQSLLINKATASLTLTNLSQSYDGAPKAALATTVPAGLSVTLTYSQNATSIASPTNAGSYTVSASINDLNYQGSATETLVISKATPTITWSNPPDIIYGTALSSTQLNATANVPGSFSYTPPTGTVLSVGSNQLSVTFTPADAANYTTASQTVQLVVEQATVTAINLSSTVYSVNEADGHIAVTINRTGNTAVAATVDYATSDTAGLQPCSVVNGIASSRCDYAAIVGTLRFAAGETSKTILIPVVNDSYAEGPESFTITLSNAVGTSLGLVNTASMTITDNDTTNGNNPVVDPAFFIRQQYLDFLGREPDPAGFQGWQDILNNCKTGPSSCDRIEVSSGFFRSPEFQARGSFIFRFYSAALGRNPSYAEFMPDLAKVSGFLSDAQLEANKAAFVQEFITRAEYLSRYNSLGNAAFVDALLQTAGLPNHPQRGAWIDVLNNGTATRAEVVRAFVESLEVYNQFYNQAFVVMQYFGYLRRDPDAAYLQWVETLNRTGDYRMMINGFLNSNEYVQRFGP